MHTQRLTWIVAFFLLLPLAVFSRKNIVLVYAYSQTKGSIYLLEDQPDGYYVKNVFACRFGYNGLRKGRTGDGKTPLGHYKVLEERKKSLKSSKQLGEFGGYFLLIDYPNYCDKQSYKTGGAIGLHGGDDNITRGCIRVLDPGRPRISRFAIEKIADFASYGTDVIITDRLSASLVDKVGSKLDENATSYWKKLVSQRRCYAEIIRGQDSKKEISDRDIDPNTIYLGTLLNSRGSSIIREKKSFGSKSLGSLRGRQTFVYLREDKEWYTVIAQNGVQGYVPKSRIRKLCTSPSGTAQINDPDGYTNLRYGPSTRSQVLRKVREGEVFFYKEVNSVWWQVITMDGLKGYMHQSRIRTVMEE